LSEEDIYQLSLKLAKKKGIKISIERKSMQRKESGLKLLSRKSELFDKTVVPKVSWAKESVRERRNGK
jgi:hypothetical protein